MRIDVDQLVDDQNIDEVYLVNEKQLRTNKNGTPYLNLILADRTGTVSAKVWNANEQMFKSFEPGDLSQVKAKAQLFQGAMQLIVNSFTVANPEAVDLTNFLPRTKHDIGKLTERLKTYLRKITDPHIRGLAEAFLIDDTFMKSFCTAPAGIKVHHAYIGGLLEHVVTMMDVADKILPLYPEVKRDLVIAGIFLHDIGKTREMTYTRHFAYSDEGQLLGHISIGIEIMAEKARQVPELTGEPFPLETLIRLKHLILSHHGDTQYGSPKVPMTPEAVALHAIDLMDSRIFITLREINDDPMKDAAWTPFNHALQRKLYKGGRNPNASDAE